MNAIERFRRWVQYFFVAIYGYVLWAFFSWFNNRSALVFKNEYDEIQCRSFGVSQYGDYCTDSSPTWQAASELILAGVLVFYFWPYMERTVSIAFNNFLPRSKSIKGIRSYREIAVGFKKTNYYLISSILYFLLCVAIQPLELDVYPELWIGAAIAYGTYKYVEKRFDT